MADKYQTQCPHCGVKFQISAQQLSLANGNVRCGSCLQVFQASANLVPLGGATPAGAPSARPASAAPSARPASAAPSARPTARPSAPSAAPPAATRPAPPPPKPAAPRVAVPPPVDESDDDLADMILKELEAPPPPPPPPVAAKPAAPAKPAATVDDPDDLADMILRELEEPAPPARPAAPEPAWAPPAAAAPAPAADPQWAPPAANKYGIEDNKTRVSLGQGQDKLLIDDAPEERFGDSRTSNPVVHDDDVFGASANTLLENIDEPVDESWAKELIGEKVEDEKDALVRKFREIKADNLALATTGVQPRSGMQERLERLGQGGGAGSGSGSGIDDDFDLGNEPDELDFLNDPGLRMQDVELPGVGHETAYDTVGMAHEVAWGREIFWGALCAVFAVLLLAQYLVFNFETLARDSTWRGVYEVACGAFGCEVPGESDVARIQGANLVVRSHPSVPGALVVDAIVYNRAPFAQPYPDLELSFSDGAGNLLAGRVFRPSEYLQGELTGSESMPPNTPVHLTLELVDPGSEAVNYEVRFLPPAASS